jgi:hypothetical protein
MLERLCLHGMSGCVLAPLYHLLACLSGVLVVTVAMTQHAHPHGMSELEKFSA